ncbi:hypothetical protein ACUY2X_04395 [Corynebacterium minutissimum]
MTSWCKRLGLTLSIATTASLLTVPTATALVAEPDTRNDKEICVVSLEEHEREITKQYFAQKIEEQIKLQNRMREEFPQYAKEFEEADNAPTPHPDYNPWLVPTPEELKEANFEPEDVTYLYFSNSQSHRNFQEWSENGYPFTWEIARNWTAEELANYPYNGNLVASIDNGRINEDTYHLAEQLPWVYEGLSLSSHHPSIKLERLKIAGNKRLEVLEGQFNQISGAVGHRLSMNGHIQTIGMMCEQAYGGGEPAKEAKPSDSATAEEIVTPKEPQPSEREIAEEKARQEAYEKERAAIEAAREAAFRKKIKEVLEEELAQAHTTSTSDTELQEATDRAKKAEEAANAAEAAARKAEKAAQEAEAAFKAALKQAEEKSTEPNPQAPENNESDKGTENNTSNDGSSTAGIVGIILAIATALGIAAFNFFPQLRF